MSNATALDRALATHHNRWGKPDLIVRAPGRVNLIGEHTDYNEGFTMPMALPFDTVFVISRNGDPLTGPVTIESEGFGTITMAPGDDPGEVAPWATHLAGVIDLLNRDGVPSGGWRATVATDIPTGASLSSSAALEVAEITGILALNDRSWPRSTSHYWDNESRTKSLDCRAASWISSSPQERSPATPA